MFLPSASNTCLSTTARPRRYSKTSYSTCPVASGLLQRCAGRSSSFHIGTVPANPAPSGTHRYGSQAAWPCDAALRELHWLPVAARIQYKLCLLVHKSLLEHTPEYISDLLTSVANIPGWSTLRASSCGNLVVPRTCRRIGDRAFSVAALRAWNWLPTELKLLRSTDLFRRDLKTFLFHSLIISCWTQDLFLSYRTDCTDSRTI